MNDKPVKKQRFEFIDQFRGFIGTLMLLGHCSYYFNSVWIDLDPLAPHFDSQAQCLLRYIGYLCAPGFLMMNGAMVWWSYDRRIAKGTSRWQAGVSLIERGLFLIVVQMTWVNSSWGGFRVFKPWHLGVISCIGLSMICLTLIIHWRWYYRLLLAAFILAVHPFLLKIPYDHESTLERVLMQTFIDSGTFNKYPLLPWFAMAILGSVMATCWLQRWTTDSERIRKSLVVAVSTFLLAILIRLMQGYGNILPYCEVGSWTFFMDQKYPPSLFMSLWFFAAVVSMVTLFIAMGRIAPQVLSVFSIPGKVPLFFYAVHLAFLGVFIKRFDFHYRDGGILETLLATAVLLCIMLPLCKWFYGVRSRSGNYFIRMM
ncbi:hypothetical protein Q31b_24930 [Novipirellula aureliae]|uniref:Heparan-alpha-glucosaminide N-acetyltransferase catalytic domain-containing protein n=1 Tax=Novipirellula aureliae TaxID=2527966 RepID=A0A5C6E3I7_9BACT|nr:heparan-alpha-glucosaminide N-acetyltransferase domain-containing protein [Novipirellula aureliae]TWU43452.1 hypothetical protein Q31b_24930 [Novipirellula aureliae]